MADTEIKGSGRQWETARYRFGERLSVGASEDDAPSIGDYYTPPGGSQDSGVTGRKCVRVQKDKDSLPGIWLFRAVYQGFKEI